MKKLLTLTLALFALVLFTDPAVAQQNRQQPPVGVETRATTVRGSKNNSSERLAISPMLLKGTVTEVNNRANTFTAAVIFSATNLSTLPTVGEIIDVTYTETPGGGPMEVTNVKSSKSNGSDRVATNIVFGVETQRMAIKGSKSNSSDRIATNIASPKQLNGTVTAVNDQAKTFSVAIPFSAPKLSKLPTVGEIIDITYTETTDGAMRPASNLNLSKSNIN